MGITASPMTKLIMSLAMCQTRCWYSRWYRPMATMMPSMVRLNTSALGYNG
jgi:hypothetical protein